MRGSGLEKNGWGHSTDLVDQTSLIEVEVCSHGKAGRGAVNTLVVVGIGTPRTAVVEDRSKHSIRWEG